MVEAWCQRYNLYRQIEWIDYQRYDEEKDMLKKALGIFLVMLLALGTVASALPAQADTTLVIGTVTVTHYTSVNVRSGGGLSYPVIYSAQPGEVFQCTGYADTGWYQIVLPTGGFGYISNNLTNLALYPNPIPLGNNTPNQVFASITVYYRSTAGQLLHVETLQGTYGENVLYANDSKVPSGYTLVSPRRAAVTVDFNGVPTPPSVTFTYAPAFVTQPPAQTAVVAVYYRDIYGSLLATTNLTLLPGAHLVSADYSKVPWGYTLVGAKDAVVSVSAYGAANPSSVIFLFARQALPTATPVPAPVTLPVYYKSNTGMLLNAAYIALNTGNNVVTANTALVPAGYIPVGAQSQNVYVAYGAANPASITFTYSKIATPAPAPSSSILVKYMSTTGQLLRSVNVAVNYGQNTITANDGNVPAGYVLVGNRYATVSVDYYGNKTPSSVTFLYTYAATATPRPAGTLVVYYKSNTGATLNTANVTVIPGYNTIRANPALVPAGYVPIGDQTANVYYYASTNTVSPASITFTYMPPATATPAAAVIVYYKSDSGVTLNTASIPVVPGNNTITANPGLVPAGYVPLGDQSANVYYYASTNTVSPDSITFTYSQVIQPAPGSATIPIYYKDTNGTTFYTAYVDLAPGDNTIYPNPAFIPAGYTPVEPQSANVYYYASTGTPSPSSVTFLYQGGGGQVPPPVQPPVQPPVIPSGEPQYLPDYSKFQVVGGPYDVYTGPGPSYYQVPGASVSSGSGTCRIYGKLGDWAMIGYELSNGKYRIGYVTRSAIPDNVWNAASQLNLVSKPMTTTGAVYFTDDPVIGGDRGTNRLEYYGSAGLNVNVLAWLRDPDSFWAYVEIVNFSGGKNAWAFIARRKL